MEGGLITVPVLVALAVVALVRFVATKAKRQERAVGERQEPRLLPGEVPIRSRRARREWAQAEARAARLERDSEARAARAHEERLDAEERRRAEERKSDA